MSSFLCVYDAVTVYDALIVVHFLFSRKIDEQQHLVSISKQ